jgi:hypothetical protein
MLYATLWYGHFVWAAVKKPFQKGNKREDYDDPYVKLMSFDPRV